MNKLFVYSIATMVSLFSAPGLAHADWHDHHGHYRSHGRNSVVVVRQSYPAYYYSAPSYYAVPSYQYIPAPEPVAVTPQPVYSVDSSGDYCREFTRNILIDGSKQKAYGTACREPDGSWQIQNN